MVAAYPGNPSHPGALTRCKPSCTDQQCGPAKHSRTMTNDCDRSHSVMSRHNYMRKRNWQLYWSSMESQTVLFDSRISWISKMWLCRSMMVTCLHGARLSDSSGWNGPLNPLNVKIPLQLELKPWQNLLSRTLSRHQNEIVVMPSKIVVKWRRMKW